MLLHERAQVYKRSRGPGGAGTNFQLSVKHHQQSRALALVFTQNTPDETRDDTVRTVSTKQFVIASIPFVHGHGTCKSDCRHVSWIMDGHRSASAHSASRIHPSIHIQASNHPPLYRNTMSTTTSTGNNNSSINNPKAYILQPESCVSVVDKHHQSVQRGREPVRLVLLFWIRC